jgi:hypothetical protein
MKLHLAVAKIKLVAFPANMCNISFNSFAYCLHFVHRTINYISHATNLSYINI